MRFYHKVLPVIELGKETHYFVFHYLSQKLSKNGVNRYFQQQRKVGS